MQLIRIIIIVLHGASLRCYPGLIPSANLPSGLVAPFHDLVLITSPNVVNKIGISTDNPDAGNQSNGYPLLSKLFSLGKSR